MSQRQMDILRQGFDDMSRGNLEAVVDTWADDITFVFPGTTRLSGFYQGKEEVERCVWTLMQLMPDISIQVINTMDGPDMVAAEWIKRSTAPDGTVFENRGITIAQFRDDKVVVMRDYLDTEKLALLTPPKKQRAVAGRN